MPGVAKGHIEQLPSGSLRISVYAGIDPLTRRAIRLKSTVKVSALQGIGTGVIRHALEALTADGLIMARPGRAVVARQST